MQLNSLTIKQDTTADGTYQSARISSNKQHSGIISIVFKDASGDYVTPTAGKAIIEISENNYNWKQAAFGLVDVRTTAYFRPTFTGVGIRYYRVTLKDVAGAAGFETTLRLVDGTMSELGSEPPLVTKIVDHSTTTGIKYVCKTISGVGDNEALWLIQRIDESVSGTVAISYASGSKQFDQVFADRESLTY